VSGLSVNTFPTSKVTLISHECISVTSLESILHSSLLHLGNGMGCLGYKTLLYSEQAAE
jgi:hypothetical protein